MKKRLFESGDYKNSFGETAEELPREWENGMPLPT
jgi:hypothetical protein